MFWTPFVCCLIMRKVELWPFFCHHLTLVPCLPGQLILSPWKRFAHFLWSLSSILCARSSCAHFSVTTLLTLRLSLLAQLVPPWTRSDRSIFLVGVERDTDDHCQDTRCSCLACTLLNSSFLLWSFHISGDHCQANYVQVWDTKDHCQDILAARLVRYLPGHLIFSTWNRSARSTFLVVIDPPIPHFWWE